MSIKLDTITIRSINAFEKLTGVGIKDCIIEGNMAFFVVESGKVGKAIGKNGRTIKKLQESINKKARVFEYSNDVEQFIKNFVPVPLENVEIENNPGKVLISVDRKKRSIVVGKDGRNIRILSQFLKRLFGIEEVKIR